MSLIEIEVFEEHCSAAEKETLRLLRLSLQKQEELESEVRETKQLVKELIRIVLKNQPHNDVVGGSITRIGDIMNPIQPGNTVKFLVTPAFSGAAFTLDGSKAAVTSSDPTNFPVDIDLVGDPTGATFESVIPASATPTGGSEAITVDWSYTNLDGIVAHVTGTVTELGIVDDVTGGTFAQVA